MIVVVLTNCDVAVLVATSAHLRSNLGSVIWPNAVRPFWLPNLLLSLETRPVAVLTKESVAVFDQMQCGRFGSYPAYVDVLTKAVWPFWPKLCCRSGSDPTQCGRSGCGHFGVWPFWLVPAKRTVGVLWNLYWVPYSFRDIFGSGLTELTFPQDRGVRLTLLWRHHRVCGGGQWGMGAG